MVTDDKISFQDLCLLGHNAVLPGKQLTAVSEAAILFYSVGMCRMR